MTYNREYYIKNKPNWKRGGKYYKYKTKLNQDKIKIKKGKFLISFN